MPRSRQSHRASKSQKAADRSGTRQKRATSGERRQEFIQKAIDYFAEVGFDGGTRELAQRLGVTQPLLYRYFPSKEALIGAVYRQIFIDRWDPNWDELLADSNRPLRERLHEFYLAYTEVIFAPEWLRIYLFAGLRGVEINRWYTRVVEDLVLKRIAAGLREERGLPTDLPISRAETEIFWVLHGGIFYYGVRRYIYGLPVQEDTSAMIANALDAFLNGAGAVLDRLAAEQQAAAQTGSDTKGETGTHD